jgi:hypothetical protein
VQAATIPGTRRGRRSAGFQTCCIADFQVGSAMEFGWPADLEIRDTADLEVCATFVGAAPRCAASQNCILLRLGKSRRARTFGRSADYKLITNRRYGRLQIITNLRYGGTMCAKYILRRGLLSSATPWLTHSSFPKAALCPLSWRALAHENQTGIFFCDNPNSKQANSNFMRASHSDRCAHGTARETAP